MTLVSLSLSPNASVFLLDRVFSMRFLVWKMVAKREVRAATLSPAALIYASLLHCLQ